VKALLPPPSNTGRLRLKCDGTRTLTHFIYRIPDYDDKKIKLKLRFWGKYKENLWKPFYNTEDADIESTKINNKEYIGLHLEQIQC